MISMRKDSKYDVFKGLPKSKSWYMKYFAMLKLKYSLNKVTSFEYLFCISFHMSMAQLDCVNKVVVGWISTRGNELFPFPCFRQEASSSTAERTISQGGKCRLEYLDIRFSPSAEISVWLISYIFSSTIQYNQLNEYINVLSHFNSFIFILRLKYKLFIKQS